MKLHKFKKRTAEPKNIESSSGRQVSKDGIASGFAFGYDPTGRSVLFKSADIPSQFFCIESKEITSKDL
jgi:hypothetical protein